jgi:hypothetical protein
MPRQSGQLLLSALRKAKSKSALLETPEAYFEEGDERDAYKWLRDYVTTHNAWPSPRTFERETGVTAGLVAEPLSYYLNDARKKALFESLMDPMSQLRRAMEAQNPDGAMKIMRECIAAESALNHRQEGLITFSQSMEMVREDYDVARRLMGNMRGIPTGWDFTDEAIQGWQNSNVYTVVGRPKRGKSQLLLHSAMTARAAGYSVLFLSMEMGVLELAQRAYGLATKVNPRLIRAGQLSSHQQTQFYKNLNLMGAEETPFYWLAGNFKKTMTALEAAIYETEPDLIIADASYLIKPAPGVMKFGGRRELIAEVIEQQGALAKKVDRPLLQSVQFNRTASKPTRGEADQDKRNPIGHLDLSKIGETDVVGQVSSAVLGVDFGDAPNEHFERYVGFLAGRNGEDGWMKINYKFQPVDLSEITNSKIYKAPGVGHNGGPDLGFMDAET